MVFRNHRSGWHVVKYPLSLTSMEKKTKVDPRTLPQLNPASSMWQSYLTCLTEKEQKNITGTLVAQKIYEGSSF